MAHTMTFSAFGLCVVRVRTALYAFVLCGTMLVSRDVGMPPFFSIVFRIIMMVIMFTITLFERCGDGFVVTFTVIR